MSKSVLQFKTRSIYFIDWQLLITHHYTALLIISNISKKAADYNKSLNVYCSVKSLKDTHLLTERFRSFGALSGVDKLIVVN